MKFSFFRGCFIPVRLPYIEKVSRLVLGELGVELHDIDGFTCCPEPVGFQINDRFAATVIAARNISLAEDAGKDVITLCNGCTYVLRQANEELKADEGLRDRVNDVLSSTDHQFRGTVDVKHFAHILKEDVGVKRIKEKVEKPLSGLTVAGHTGCHIVSPVDVMGFDDPFDPVVLDEMVAALGAEPADFDLKTLCCGWTLTNYGDRESANKLVGAKLSAMKGAGSDCITAICPQCFYQFDTGQMLASRQLGLDFKLPVTFYLQLLALSMGYSLEDIHYRMHRVRDPGFEDKMGRLLS
ncbi:MAG: CoB--CoM heterodisulfide reductase subunit B [Candidatus Bathyarchaeota archaeon]|nr:MAG: CoB--CoM heterodisulfide reductase subunit B [Candidatus Bathyarchaeota archaeon]